MNKGIDDQLANGGNVKRIKIASAEEFWRLGHSSGAHGASKRTSIPSRPEIITNGKQIIEVIADAWKAVEWLNEQEEVPKVFSGLGTLVRLERREVIKDRPKEYAIAPMTVDQVHGTLLRAADWIKELVSERDGVTHSPTKPDKDYARDLLAFPSESLPRLDSIIQSPRYTSSGTLLLKPGYYPSEGIFFDPRGELPMDPIPSHPSDEDILWAKEQLEEVFGQFPFKSKSDKAHAIGRPIAIFGRRMINGVTPLHSTEAFDPGTGKGLLEHVIALITRGQYAELTVLPECEKELAKTILSLMVSGSEFVIFDNADEKRTINSATLASVLTAEIWKGRELGYSQILSAPNIQHWAINGNNVKMNTDISRRTIRTRLHANTDQPWMRTGFKHPKLKTWIKENRGQIVRAYLILIQNWISTGCKPGDKLLGSFEEYCEFVGGVLASAGIDGFLDDLQDFYAVADVEAQAWRDFAGAWWKKFCDAEVTSADLNQMCEKEELLIEVRGQSFESEKSQTTSLGIKLKARVGRPIGRFVIEIADDNPRGRKYKLTAEDPDLLASQTKGPEAGPQQGPESSSSEKSSASIPKGDLGDLVSYSLDEKRNASPDMRAGTGCRNVPNVPTQSLTARQNNERTKGTFAKDDLNRGPSKRTMRKDDYDKI